MGRGLGKAHTHTLLRYTYTYIQALRMFTHSKYCGNSFANLVFQHVYVRIPDVIVERESQSGFFVQTHKAINPIHKKA